jgi:REP element-mobilizing transposase RayT
MCSLFRNKFRNESIRLNGHDYSSGSKYFITICTKQMLNYFGYISAGKKVLSESGTIAEKTWLELPDHFSSISLDEFIIMPNHIHGIIIIESQNSPQSPSSQINQFPSPVRTLHATSLHRTKSDFMTAISPKPGSLATVIRSYKSAVSKNIHSIDPDFSWHPRYYDHIIRSDRELDRIRKYIINNPANWDNH